MIRTVTAKIDTFVASHRPKNNYGNKLTIQLDGNGSATQRGIIYVPRPFPLGSTIVLAKLRLRLSEAWSGGPHTITTPRAKVGWKELVATWNNKPAEDTQNQGSVAVTNGVLDQLVEVDVTNLMQDVSSGSPYHGFYVKLDTSGVKRIHSTEAIGPNRRPELEVTWAVAPDAPTDLVPSANAAISAASPKLSWLFKDADEGDEQSQWNVQLDDASDFATPLWDSGWVAGSEMLCDLARNLLTKNQSDLEVDTTGWVAGANATIARTTAQFYQGVASLRMTAVGAGNMFANTTTGTGGRPVVGNTEYSCQARFRPNSTVRSVRVDALWYDSGGAFISTSNGTAVSEVASAWTLATATFTSPSNAAYVALQVVVVSAVAAEIHDVDVFMISAGNLVPAWQPGFDGIPDSVTRYWRVRVKDSYGATSAWSAGAQFQRFSYGTLAITVPAADPNDFVEETEPTIEWTLTGRTQAQARIKLEEKDSGGAYIQVYDSGWVGTGFSNLTVPRNGAHGHVRKFGADMYRITVQVKDTVDRMSVPGDVGYVSATRLFEFKKSGAVTPVSTVDATQEGGHVKLTWTRASAPTYFAVVVDGIVEEDRIVPADVFVSGTTYAKKWFKAKVGSSHTYEVQAVVDTSGVLKHSDTNPTDAHTSTAKGAWLIVPADGLEVNLRGEVAALELGEKGTLHEPPGRGAPAWITESLRGYEGTVSGLLLDDGSTNPDTWRDRLIAIKALKNSKETRLSVGKLNIPVTLGPVRISPVRMGRYEVELQVWQDLEA